MQTGLDWDREFSQMHSEFKMSGQFGGSIEEKTCLLNLKPTFYFTAKIFSGFYLNHLV